MKIEDQRLALGGLSGHCILAGNSLKDLGIELFCSQLAWQRIIALRRVVTSSDLDAGSLVLLHTTQEQDHQHVIALRSSVQDLPSM